MKPHIEFSQIDMNSGWENPGGYPDGIYEKVLASDLDEIKKTGSRTRLLRFEPGAFTQTLVVHDYWEEVFVFSGDFIVDNDADGKDGYAYGSETYACRPPGVYHGPFKSEEGCVLFEIHYY